MTPNDALRQLQHGNSVNCIAPNGKRFQIQSKLSYGIAWYRVRPAHRGLLNRYSRLSDRHLREWLESIEFTRQID